MTNSPHLGVMAAQIKRTRREMQRTANTLEEMCFGSLWVTYHLDRPKSLEIPMLKAGTPAVGMAALTEKPEVGKRRLSHTGKTIATVDTFAGGRIIPGSSRMARGFSDFGIPASRATTGRTSRALHALMLAMASDEGLPRSLRPT